MAGSYCFLYGMSQWLEDELRLRPFVVGVLVSVPVTVGPVRSWFVR